MDVVFVILIIICAVALMAVVLIQNAKGGGLASNVGLSTQMLGGVKKATEGIEKLTWGLMIALFLLCIVSGYFFNAPTSPEQTGPKVDDITDVIPPQVQPINPANLGQPAQPATPPTE